MSIKSVLFCIALGALYAQSFAPGPLAPFLLPWLNVFVLATLVHLSIRTDSIRSAFKIGGLFGLGTFVTGLYWLVISMNVHGGMPLVLAIVALVLFSTYLALYPALATGLMRFLWRDGKKHLTPLEIILMASLWAGVWTLTEWLRATILTGFAWLQTAAGQADGWLAGWSAWIGPYGIAFLTAWVAAALAATLANTAAQGSNAFGARQSVALVIAGLLCVAGAFLGQYRFSAPTGDPLVIRLIQGDIDQATKFSPQGFAQAVDIYQSLASHQQEGQSVRPDLILLPETVMTYMPYRVPAQVWESWIRIARDSDAMLLMGGPMPGPSRGSYTNSIFSVTGFDSAASLSNGQVQARYDKQHLVPFGEIVPWGFRWFVDWMNIPLGDFTAGLPDQSPLRIGSQQVAPNICYEDVFAEELLPAVRQGATILANFSNLAWFGDSVALRQHWQMSRLRAMETQRPMVRSTNTGMTGAIGPSGEVIAILPSMVAGYVDVQIQGLSGLTLYARTGNAPVLALSLLILGAGLFRRLRHRGSGS